MISGPPEPADEEHNQPPYTELGRGRPSVFTGKSGSQSTTRESESIYVVTGQICVPATASDYILMFWPFGLTWCRTVQYIIYVTAYVSIYTLVLMAGDRFMAVVFPVTSLSYRTITNAKIAIAATWVTPSLLVIPVWYAHNLHAAEKREFPSLSTCQPQAGLYSHLFLN